MKALVCPLHLCRVGTGQTLRSEKRGGKNVWLGNSEGSSITGEIGMEEMA